jgi:hypothetical protein
MKTGRNVYVDAVRAFKRKLLLDAVKAEKGNMCRASIRLGVARSTMTRAMREVGLSASQLKQYREGFANGAIQKISQAGMGNMAGGVARDPGRSTQA